MITCLDSITGCAPLDDSYSINFACANVRLLQLKQLPLICVAANIYIICITVIHLSYHNNDKNHKCTLAFALNSSIYCFVSGKYFI